MEEGLSVMGDYQCSYTGLKAQDPTFAEFCHPQCDQNVADPHEKCKSLCIKPTTQNELKTPGGGPW